MCDETDDNPHNPSAPGDGPPRQPEEEELPARTAGQKELVDAPPRDILRHQLEVEKERLARVLARFEEEHGALYSEPCLICLDDIHVHASEKNMRLYFCCGGFICVACVRGIEKSGKGFENCPLCRKSLAKAAGAKDAERLMALAERGVVWAQTQVGRCMTIGVEGFEKQAKTGLKWLNKAAAQEFPPAIYLLSCCYSGGLAPVLEESQEKTNELLLKSANLGYRLANSWLAKSQYAGMNGFDKDPDEAYFRASLSIALDGSDEYAAAYVLGNLHLDEQNVPEPSPYLACYYLNIAANEDDDGIACLVYSKAILNLSKHIGAYRIPGLPAAFFWLRKSRELGCNEARMQLKKWESIGQSYCANCFKEAHGGEKFKQCSKCKAQWYCSKECQVEAWKAGHKRDCKRASILKFEDYLIAE